MLGHQGLSDRTTGEAWEGRRGLGGEHALVWVGEEEGAWAVEVERNGDDDSIVMSSTHTAPSLVSRPPPSFQQPAEGAGLEERRCKCEVNTSESCHQNGYNWKLSDGVLIWNQ